MRLAKHVKAASFASMCKGHVSSVKVEGACALCYFRAEVFARANERPSLRSARPPPTARKQSSGSLRE